MVQEPLIHKDLMSELVGWPIHCLVSPSALAAWKAILPLTRSAWILSATAALLRLHVISTGAIGSWSGIARPPLREPLCSCRVEGHSHFCFALRRIFVSNCSLAVPSCSLPEIELFRLFVGLAMFATMCGQLLSHSLQPSPRLIRAHS